MGLICRCIKATELVRLSCRSPFLLQFYTIIFFFISRKNSWGDNWAWGTSFHCCHRNGRDHARWNCEVHLPGCWATVTKSLVVQKRQADHHPRRALRHWVRWRGWSHPVGGWRLARAWWEDHVLCYQRGRESRVLRRAYCRRCVKILTPDIFGRNFWPFFLLLL